MMFYLIFHALIFAGIPDNSTLIDVTEHGISNGQRDSKQQDRDEAILDTQLKAIENAGVNIKSIMEVDNYVLKKEWIESRDEAFLLPDFKIIDIGYGEDGVYHIVLSGKVATNGRSMIDDPFSQKYRYASSLFDENPEKACQLLGELVDQNTNHSFADDALWEIIYYKYTHEGETQEMKDLVKKMNAYFPESPFITAYRDLDQQNAAKYDHAISVFEKDAPEGIRLLSQFVNTYPSSAYADDALWQLIVYRYKSEGEDAKVKELVKELKTDYPQSEYIAKYHRFKTAYIPMRK